jgi:hypothetical protein
MDKRACVYSDLALARRLERCEGSGCAGFVQARARLFPDGGASWMKAGGTYAMFDGVESPITQTFGLGLFEAATDEVLDSIEAFFLERGAPVYHEVSPLAGVGTLQVLHRRGYLPVELTSVLYRSAELDLELPLAPNLDLAVHRIGEADRERYVETSVRGWSEFQEVADQIRTLAMITAHRFDAHCFLVELDGTTIAAGALSIWEDVALLAGACTVPEGRRQGAQLALLQARLRFAAEQGCTLAMMGALPGSTSQRNAERQGFRIAYTRVKWHLEREPLP